MNFWYANPLYVSPWVYVVIVSLVFNYGCWIWGLRRFFRVNAAGMPTRMKVLQLMASIAMIVNITVVWRAELSTMCATGGIGLAMVSALLFFSAISANRARPLAVAFTEHAPQHLNKNGPYRVIRHPFYTSYTIGWLAGAVAAQSWVLGVIVVILFYFYRDAASLEEKQFKQSSLAQEHLKYQSETGMFFPRLFKA